MTRLRATSVALCALLVGCSESAPSALEPAGPGAARIERLWWILLWIAAAVFVVVIAMMVIAVLRRRDGVGDGATDQPRWGERLLAVGGVAIPTVVLATVFFISLGDIRFLSTSPGSDALRIEVVGRTWWWEVHYGGGGETLGGATTANEIHIPVGQPVVLELTTDDVIHSVWVPELNAKTDMIPGRTTEMTIEADSPGVYRGQCAEFCGLQHAKMAFYVVAEEPDRFEAWLDNEASPRPPDVAPEGEALFLGSSCAGCHSVRGTAALSDRGPDLTHFASRDSIAAGTLINARAELIRWIEDPQSIKPGAQMPPAELTRAEIETLVDYLGELR